MCPQAFPGSQVATLGQQPDVHFAQPGAEPVGVFQRLKPVAVVHGKYVVARPVSGDGSGKKTAPAGCQFPQDFTRCAMQRLNPLRIGNKRAQPGRRLAGFGVWPQFAERVPAPALLQGQSQLM